MNVYKTVSGISEGFYKEKGSKFIAYAYPVESIADVKDRIAELKKKHFDARHYCFGHIIENGNQQSIRANDDGEPGHSAGDPILGQIRSFELTNTLVVVVRYFGGTKLGVSGLIHAYKSAAEEALQNARIKTVEIKTKFRLQYGYEKTNDVMRITSDFGVEILSQEFVEDCTLIGKIEPEKFQSLKDKLALIQLNPVTE